VFKLKRRVKKKNWILMTKHKTPPSSPSKPKSLCGIPQNDFVQTVASILSEISDKNTSKVEFESNSFSSPISK
jgi:hypothetical protein